MSNLYESFSVGEKGSSIFAYLQDATIFTYEKLDERVSQFCHFLKEIGIKKGDRVIQKTHKSLDGICLYLAVIKYGAIYVPLNPGFTLNETVYFIEDLEPALFICDGEDFEKISDYINSSKKICQIFTLNVSGDGTIQNAIRNLSNQFESIIGSHDDIACILYTSGTTGKPKGAMLSHNNLRTNAEALVKLWGITSSDVLLHTLPIFHCHGLFFACHTVLLSGAQMIFLPKFDVDTTIKYLQSSTIFMGVPTYYSRLLSDACFDKALTKEVRLFISGSAPLLKKTFLEFEHRTGEKILERYGMTETGINTSNPLNGERICDSVGLPLPNTKVRIVNVSDADLGINTEGHIQVKGENVFLGYWRKEDQRHMYFTEDLYFRTGDIGLIKENGYLTILDRANDLVISGGMNVYPKEIENVINQMDEVVESAVLGLAHDDFGEEVVAVIVKEENSVMSEEAIFYYLKQNLAGYKIPKKIFFLRNLPKNQMGKIQKNILKELLKIPSTISY